MPVCMGVVKKGDLIYCVDKGKKITVESGLHCLSCVDTFFLKNAPHNDMNE